MFFEDDYEDYQPDADDFMEDAIASEYSYGNGNFEDGWDYDLDGDNDV